MLSMLINVVISGEDGYCGVVFGTLVDVSVFCVIWSDLLMTSKIKVNMYLNHLKFCVMCINSRRYVGCSECYVVSNECDEHTPCLVQPIGAHGGEVMYFGSFCFSGELGFLKCAYICMCVVNKQFGLLRFVFNSVYVDLKYKEISLTFTVEVVCLCVVM